MTHTFLLEIGLEEMPSRFIQSSINQLQKRMEDFLNNEKLTYGKIVGFSTPRRLALLVTELSEKQSDQTELIKGPSKKAGMDSEGNLTKAAQGFARSKQIHPEELYVEDVNGVPYLFAEKQTKGKYTADILSNVSNIIENMDFPISMHWANHSFKYIRPVHWVVALLDDQVIPVTALDVTSGRVTSGHRFLGEETEISEAQTYEETLKKQFVIVNRNARKQQITEQIKELQNQEGWHVPKNDSLLDEITDMVEFPTAFFGTFDSAFLKIPDSALVTTMRDHQRYFDVRDKEENILPFFVAVRNGNAESIDTVIKGNEKVLRARLADAVFFFEDDLKLSIEESIDKLKRVNFYEGMGSLYDKSVRVQKIALIIGHLIHLEKNKQSQVNRAAEIAKFDLVTNMVDEFPELQGVMGDIYARMMGEDSAVAQSIKEQYMPISSKGELPASTIGSVLSISEKLDNLFMFFQAGIIPTGSNDPFALRRQAFGIIRILLSEKWSFPINDIIENLSSSLLSIKEENAGKLKKFLLNRLNQYLIDEGCRYDVIEAVLHSNQQDVLTLHETALVLQSHLEDSNFKAVLESLTRVSNLAQKAEGEVFEASVNPELLETPSEKHLYEKMMVAVDKIKKTQSKDSVYEIMSALHEPIDAFFEQNMVMTDDENIRVNRLKLLKKINRLVSDFADVSKLVVK